MASIRKRGTTSWEAQVRVRGCEPQTRNFRTKAEATQWASELEARMRRGTHVDTSSLKAWTVHMLLEQYLNEVTPTKKGAEVEAYRLGAMMRLPMAMVSLDRLTTPVVIGWRDERSRSVSADTVARELNLLSSVINYARSEWSLPMPNPVAGVRRPKQGRGRSRRPSWRELRRLLSGLVPKLRKDGFWVGTRNRWILPAVLLALRTAMRRGEILAMRWEHVDFANRCVHLPDTKNGEPRDVPLSRKAELILKRLQSKDSAGAVFPVSMEAFKQAFARAMERSGIEDLRFHDFRHDATTRMASRLHNVLELSAVTGHKSLNTLKRYYNPDPSDLARKLD